MFVCLLCLFVRFFVSLWFNKCVFPQKDKNEVFMQNEEIKQEYKKRRTRQLLIGIPLFPIAFSMGLLRRSDTVLFEGIPNSTLSMVGLIVILAALAFSFYNWRCPSCKGYLGRGFNPRHCHKCGCELR